jgi:membrane-associated PAP2 superfamily phosphatase
MARANPGTLSAATPLRPRASLDDLHLTLLALVLVLLWDLSGLDRAALRLVGSAQGFAWRHHPLTAGLLHDGGRILGWAVFARLVLNLRWPAWPRVARAQRLRWLVAVVACIALVTALKRLSRTSCPWDLAEFGGVAQYVSHWRLGVPDGGPGRCFPSGHATAAFAFIGGWFVLRDAYPRTARAWLVGVLLAGTLLGAGQWLRGAHPPSHTLWTAWLCWAASAWLLARRPARGLR